MGAGLDYSPGIGLSHEGNGNVRETRFQRAGNRQRQYYISDAVGATDDDITGSNTQREDLFQKANLTNVLHS